MGVKISALPPAGTLADDDETPFVDDSVGTTKKFTLAGLVVWLQSLTSLITHTMLGTDASWAWQSWSPTLSGRFDDTKWNKTGAYTQIGKTVFFRLKLVANAATPMSGGSSDARFSLPVTAVTYAPTEQSFKIGTGGIYDASPAALYDASPIIYNAAPTTTGIIRWNAPGISAITSATPMTWASGDEITITGSYEAA